VQFLRECVWKEEDPGVRVWSALYLLPYDEPFALAALKTVADGNFRTISLSAEVTIDEWKAGRLKVE
jgi:hypothetical protein